MVLHIHLIFNFRQFSINMHAAVMMTMMMMMMMVNSFCGMVDRRKAFSLISSRNHCQRSSPSRISDTPWAGFEPAQNLSSGFVEWSLAAGTLFSDQKIYYHRKSLRHVYFEVHSCASTSLAFLAKFDFFWKTLISEANILLNRILNTFLLN